MNSVERAGPREWAGLAVLALPVLLMSLDMSVLYLALPELSADLAPSATQQLWITDIYGLMLGGFLLSMGTLGDRIGRRRLLLIGATAFGAASVLAAFSWSAEALIVTRALLGVAAATLMPSTLALIVEMFRDPGQRARAIGVWMTCFITGTVIGPIVGGVMLQVFWWGSVFLLAVPVMVVLLVAGPRLLPEVADGSAGRIDLPSVALALVAILSLASAVKSAAQNGIGVVTLAALVVTTVAGTVFVRRQLRLASPLLDVSLFRRRAFSASLVVLLVGGTAVGGIYLFFTQYLQVAEGLSPLAAGVWLLVPSVVLAASSMGSSSLAARLGPGIVIALGFAVAGGGFLLMTTIEPGQGPLLGTVAMSAVYCGFGPVAVLGTDLVIGGAPSEQAGSASAVSETGAELGTALGVAVIGSVGLAVYQGRLAAQGVIGPVTESLSGPTAPGASPDAAAKAVTAFVDALSVASLTCAGIVAFLAVLSIALLRHARLGVQDGPVPEVAQGTAGSERAMVD